MDPIISVSSMAFDGYPLETALDELAALGVRYVEPASVDKVLQHLAEEDFCDARAAWLRQEMVARRLACLSLSAHMDLTQPDSVDRFSRRLAFARAIGARIVSTIAGPTSGLAGFQANIAAIGERAADLGLTVALENHGDLMNRGRQIVQLCRTSIILCDPRYGPPLAPSRRPVHVTRTRVFHRGRNASGEKTEQPEGTKPATL